MARYGPLVSGLCRRMLPDAQAAEDAFQATFLVLVRKASTVRKSKAVGSWLYGVAYRVALRARVGPERGPAREVDQVAAPGPEPGEEVLRRELHQVLDDEVHRLPEKYRAPVLLCYLQGKTFDEAARQLRCPLGTLATRLAWARERLRCPLTQRGLTLSAATLAATLTEQTGRAAVPAALAQDTIKALTAAPSDWAVLLRADAVLLSEGVLRMMAVSRIRSFATVSFLVGLLGLGAGLLAYPVLAGKVAQAGATGAGARPKSDEELFQGTWIVTAMTTDGIQTPADKLKKAADDPNGARIVVEKDRMSFVEDGKSQPLTFKLDSAKKPKAITFFDPGREDKPAIAWGIYDVGADEFRLCHAKKDEGPPPAEFAAGQGTGRRLIVARREQKKEGGAARGRETDRLQGRWKIIAVAEEGRAETKEQLKPFELDIRGDKVTLTTAAGASSGTYTLDADKQPAQLDMIFTEGVAKDATVRVLYALDGAKLTLCLSDDPTKRPTAFENQKGVSILTLQRSAPPVRGDNSGAKNEPPRGESLEGIWTIVSTKGRSLGASEVNAQWHITADRMIAKLAGKVDQMMGYRIRANQNPQEITITDGAKVLHHGIYRLQNGTLLLCLSDPPAWPTDFTAPANSGRLLIEFRREAPAAGGPKLQSLLKDRFDTASQEWNDRKLLFEAGRGEFDLLFGASRRLLDAHLDLAQTKEERLRVLEAHVKRMQDVYEAQKARFDAGRIAPQDLNQAKFYRLEAEIMLERAKAADK